MTETDPAAEPAADETTAGDDWRAALPDELRGHSALDPIRDIAGLAKSFVSAQELVGADKVAIPAADAPAEKWDAFYARLGRPDRAEDYVLNAPDGLPDRMDYSDEAAGRFKQWAFEAGLTSEQASRLHGAFVDSVADTVSALESADTQAVAEADRAIREAWGTDYDRNLELAGRAVQVLGGEPLIASLTRFGALDEEGGVKDPVIAYAFAEAGKMLGEDRLAGEGEGALPSSDTARRELEQLEADPDHRAALFDESHPGHRAALDKRGRLFRLAFGA